MANLTRLSLIIILLSVLAAFPAKETKKKYHILYTGQGEGAYGPCG
jgi:hypothetical protein